MSQHFRIMVFLSAAILAASPRLTPVSGDGEIPSGPRVLKAAGSTGIRPYRFGAWGIVAVEVSNNTDRDASVLVSSSLKGSPFDQHARRFWVPANAVRRSWTHVFFPKSLDQSGRSTDIESTAYDVTNGRQVPLAAEAGKRRHSDLIPVTSRLNQSAAIASSPPLQRDPDEAAAEDAVDACLFSRFRDRRMAMLEGDALPATSLALDGLRFLVLYNDRISHDAAAMAAVRRWLQNGGRLWIMADRVRQETVEKLLGDSAPYQTVDRVDLTQVQIQSADKERWGQDERPRDFDRPVPFVRVLATGPDVPHTVNGWPASLLQRCGNGRVLYTTLGMRAWLRPFNQPILRRTGHETNFLPREPLDLVTAELLMIPPPASLKTDAFQDYVTQQIGYEIVSRNLVVGVLAAFCVGLLLTAVWLRRVRRMERMRWVAPGGAVAAAAVLTLIGAQSRHSVPETVVVAQVVDAAANSEDVTVTGLIAVYRQDGSKSTVGMQGDGVLATDFVHRPGTTRRMVWTDIDRWQWDDLKVPPGVQQTKFRFAKNIGQPLTVTARFGPNGLAGSVDTGPFRDPADAVVTTATGSAIGVRLKSDGTFVSGPDQSLPPGVFISSGLLSDEQRRRQDVYRKLWAAKKDAPLYDRPTMLVWTKPLEMGFQISGEQRRAGSALVSIPVRLDTTPPGTRVRIPAAFLPYERVLDPDGQPMTACYHPRQREWIKQTGPSRTWLRIQLPPEVRPMTVSRAVVTLHFDGPSRRLDIAGAVGRKPVIVASVPKPSGQVRIPVTRADVLRLDPQGGLLLGVFVAEDEKPQTGKVSSRVQFWRLQYVTFDVEGTTAGNR